MTFTFVILEPQAKNLIVQGRWFVPHHDKWESRYTFRQDLYLKDNLVDGSPLTQSQ